MVPLPGFEVSAIPPSPGEKPEGKHGLRLSQTQQTLLLSAPDAEHQARWLELLSRASRGEVLPDVPASQTEHGKSQ